MSTATYIDGPYVEGDPFYNGIPARNLTSLEWAALTAPVPVTIVSSDDDPPELFTTIVTATPHGFVSGDMVEIAGHTGSTPDLNGRYRVIVDEDPSSFVIAIPEPCTVPGTGGTVTKDSQQGLLNDSDLYTVAP